MAARLSAIVAVCVAGYFGSSFVVTASKHLQDQYTKDMPWFKPNKGMPNFACHKMMEKHGIELTETDFAVQNKWTCDMGTCFDKKTKKECQYKPKLTEVAEGKRKSDDCLYYLQKYQSLISSHSIWNYASYFQMMKYQKEKYAQYLNKKVAIFDEAHRIEDQIIQFVGIDIYERNLNECKIDVENYDLEDIDDVMKLSDGLSESYARQISNLEDSRAFAENPDYEVVQTLENKYKKYAEARSEIYSNKDGFTIVNVKKIIPSDTKPLDVVKGKVMSDYQNDLESKWMDELREKYKVQIHKRALKRVKKELES